MWCINNIMMLGRNCDLSKIVILYRQVFMFQNGKLADKFLQQNHKVEGKLKKKKKAFNSKQLSVLSLEDKVATLIYKGMCSFPYKLAWKLINWHILYSSVPNQIQSEPLRLAGKTVTWGHRQVLGGLKLRSLSKLSLQKRWNNKFKIR